MQRVELRGIKDGVEIALGTINETPTMYARGLIVDWFGEFTNGDDSDADYVRQMLEDVLDYAHKYEPDFDMKGTL